MEPDQPTAKTPWPDGNSTTRLILTDTFTGQLIGDYVYGAQTGGAFVRLKATKGEELWRSNIVTDGMSGTSVHVTRRWDSAFLFTDPGGVDSGALDSCPLRGNRPHDADQTHLIVCWANGGLGNAGFCTSECLCAE